jgi:hypothetical protein
MAQIFDLAQYRERRAAARRAVTGAGAVLRYGCANCASRVPWVDRAGAGRCPRCDARAQEPGADGPDHGPPARPTGARPRR